MKRTKPLSFEEKRQRLLKIFHDRKEVLNLKDLEKYGPKEGIVLQTVKDVLDSLLADNLVLSDKIGSANFFWSLPSQTTQILKTTIINLTDEIEKMKEEKEKLMIRIENAQVGKIETTERKKKLNIMKELKETHDNLVKKMESYRKNDPENLDKLNSEKEDFKRKANFWTDNLFTTEKYMEVKRKYSKDDIRNMKKSLEICPDLDYID